jgi:hypothetical protein
VAGYGDRTLQAIGCRRNIGPWGGNDRRNRTGDQATIAVAGRDNTYNDTGKPVGDSSVMTMAMHVGRTRSADCTYCRVREARSA